MSKKVTFLGLGVMGYPMAGHLAAAGHHVTVFNRNPEKASRWVAEHPGNAVASVAEACSGAEVVFACLGDDDSVREVTGAAFPAMARGSIFVDHTTASASVARELSSAADALGIGFLDAPVSGGQAGAENGILTIMVGGESEHLAAVGGLLDCFAGKVGHMGPSGAGQLTKMVNQICIAGVVQGLAEGLAFANRAQLDPAAVIDVIGKGAAQSWQMNNRASTMIDDRYDFGFAVDWMRKDLGLALAEARVNGAQLPLTALVDQFYAEVQALGGGRWDTSSLLRRMRQ